MELSVLNKEGKETGRKVTLNDEVFGIEPNTHCVYLAVKQYLAAQRQGTHKSKQRSEIAGSTRKLGRQKGGGGARRGDINSPVLVGGGRVFGPVPRDYDFKLNKKVKQLARKSALSMKAAEGQIVVVEDLKMETPSTKAVAAMVKNLDNAAKKFGIILSNENKNVLLSAQNLKNVSVLDAESINTYAVMNSGKLVICESAVELVNNL
jgi:large subunit ribosomal protein L4